VRRTGGSKIRCDEAEEALSTSDPGGGGLDLETGGLDTAVIGGHDVGQWGVVPFIWSRGLGFGGWCRGGLARVAAPTRPPGPCRARTCMAGQSC
jgi:hypothetical protein